MALLTALNTNDFLNAITSSSSGDTIQIASDVVIDDCVWPKNTSNITVRSANIDKPAVIRGILLGALTNWKNNFAHLSGAPRATNIQGTKFDGIVFKAQRFTSMKDAGGVTRDITLSDGQGLGWRIAGTSHPSGNLTGYSENSNYCGVVLKSAAQNTVFENCTWDGYAISLDNAADGTWVKFCDTVNNPEDIFKTGAFNGLTLEYIRTEDVRGPTIQIAKYFGWTGNEVPHPDWFQQMDSGRYLIIRKSFIRDDQYRLHGGLIRMSSNGSGQTTNVTLENMELQTSHATGYLIDDTINLTCRRNKITCPVALQSGGPVLQVDPVTNSGTIVCTDNMATRLQGLAATTNGATNSSTNNNPDVYPNNFVQIRREKIGSTSGPACGAYQQGAGVILPTKPNTITSSADALLDATLIADPVLPVGDPRKTAVIKIRKAGIAGNALEVRWQIPGQPSSRPTVELTADATYRKFRMSDVVGGTSHAAYPGQTISGIKFLWSDNAIGPALSDPSTFSTSFSVPDNPLVEAWEPTNYIDFPIYRGFYEGGKSLLELKIQQEGDSAPVTLWTKPAPAFVGAATSAALSVPQPSVPVVYGAGDFLFALNYHSGTAIPGNPTPAFWSTIVAGLAGNNQAIALVGGFATAGAMTLGSFTGSGKVIAASYRGVHPSAPYIVGTPMLNASDASIAVGALSLPASDDNWRVLIIAGNLNGLAMTTPVGFVSRAATGGTPRMSLYESIDPLPSFAGLNVVMTGGSSESFGVALALKLA